MSAPGPSSRPTRRRRPPRGCRRAAGTRGALVALRPDRLALLELAELRLAAAAHDHARQLALERGLDLGHHRRRVLVAPRRVLAEGVREPLLELGHAALLRQLDVVAVDPVARELARALDRELRAPVGVERQRQRRPHGRRARYCTNGLCRTGRGAGTPVRPPTVWRNVTDVSAHLGLGLDVRQQERRERRRRRADLQGGRAHEPAAFLAVAHDLAVLDLDPRREPVAEAERVRFAHLLEVVQVTDRIRRRLVVVQRPIVNPSFDRPLTASDGIHDSDVTDDSILIAPTSWLQSQRTARRPDRAEPGIRRVGLPPPRSAWSCPVVGTRGVGE